MLSAAVLALLTGYLVVRAPIALLAVAAVALWVACMVSVRSARTLFFCVAALLPFHAFMSVNGVPAWWKEALLLILFAAVVARGGLRHHPLTWPTFAFGASVLLSAVLHRKFGVYDLAPYVAFVPLVFIIPALVDSERRLRMLALVALAGALVNAAAVIAGGLWNLELFPDYGQVSAFLGHTRSASFAGSVLIGAQLFGAAGAGVGALLLMRGVRNGMWGWIGRFVIVVVLLAAGLVSFTRGVLVTIVLGLALTPVLLLVARGSTSGRRVYGTGLVSLTLLAATALGVMVGTDTVYEKRLSVFTGSVAASDELRQDRWDRTLHIALESPVAGAGPGFTGYARVRQELGAVLATYTPDTVTVPISESNGLKVFAETGALGAAAALWLLLAAIRLLWRRLTYAPALILLVALLCVVAQGLFSATMESYLGNAIFWGLLGAAVTCARLGDRRGPDQRIV
jgi:hypothetical protein